MYGVKGGGQVTRKSIMSLSDAPVHEIIRRLGESTIDAPDFFSVNLTHHWFGTINDRSFKFRSNLRGVRGSAPQLEGRFASFEGGTVIQVNLDSRPAAFLTAILISTLVLMRIA